MTGARRSSRPVAKRGKGLSVAERMLAALRPRTVQACARCGADLCDCRDADWLSGAKDRAPTPPVSGEAE